jgi:hypothetical protein
MPRELRIEYPGAIYHVLNRGDQREDIFLDAEDRHKFLSWIYVSNLLHNPGL